MTEQVVDEKKTLPSYDNDIYGLDPEKLSKDVKPDPSQFVYIDFAQPLEKKVPLEWEAYYWRCYANDISVKSWWHV